MNPSVLIAIAIGCMCLPAFVLMVVVNHSAKKRRKHRTQYSFKDLGM